MNGYALLIGVDEVDHDHYGDDRDICCAYEDTKRISNLLDQTGLFEDRIIIKNGTDTKWDALLSDFYEFQYAANNDPAGSCDFLYFSGHGASIQLENEKERKQFLCFYDKLVLEEQIRRRIGAFNKNCSIFVVLDACHSGGIPENEMLQMSKLEAKLEMSSTTMRMKKSISADFPDIYKRFEPLYQGIINRYKGYTFSTEADVFYLLACGPDEDTFTGDFCNTPSEFTNSFIEDLSFFLSNKKTINYFDFAEYMKEYSQKTTTKTVYLNNPENLFRNTVPLMFNSKTNNMITPIVLLEITGRNVAFDLDNTVPQYLMEYSMTWEFDASNPIHVNWKTKLLGIDSTLMTDDVKYISFVFLEKQSPRNTPLPIRSLYTVDPTRTDAGFGVVVAVKDNMEIVAGINPKRTAGKVSNKLG